MENCLNVWIHCRVSTEGKRYLLNYQEDELKNNACALNMHIVGITKDISSGKNLSSHGISQMMIAIKCRKVDAVLIYSYKRITIYDDLLEEFFMFCQMYHVNVFTIGQIKYFSKYTDL